MRAVTLTFHDVVEPEARGATGFQGPGPDHYKLSPARFAACLDATARADVLLTFDDGGASALATIAPLLEARGLRGHFFVPTAHVGAPGFLDADGVRALRERGHAVGGHGHTHEPLTGLADEELEREWRTCRESLEQLLGEPVTTASVPRGFFDARVAAAAARAGFADLWTSEPWTRPRRLGGLRAHGRFAVVEDTPPARVAALCRLSPAALLRETASWQARKAARRVARRAYARLRAARLSS